ncbi:hypothetical protein V2W45_1465585 [Cenococcum geophilum]
MALLALPFEPSYTALKSLQVKEGVERVNIKVEEVKAEVDEVDKKVNKVDKKVNKVDKKDGDYYRYIMAKGFPNRVKDFWRLVLDPKTLINLTRYYLRATLRDTNISCYIELEDARKVETDNGLRQVRAREDQDNDSVIGLELTSLQDPSRVISVQIRVPSNTERRDLVELLMVAKREDPGRHSPNPEPTRLFSSKELRQLAPGLGPT